MTVFVQLREFWELWVPPFLRASALFSSSAFAVPALPHRSAPSVPTFLPIPR